MDILTYPERLSSQMVGGPGIKAIGMAASPGAGYPGASNFGTGGCGPGDSGERCLGQSRCAGF